MQSLLVNLACHDTSDQLLRIQLSTRAAYTQKVCGYVNPMVFDAAQEETVEGVMHLLLVQVKMMVVLRLRCFQRRRLLALFLEVSDRLVQVSEELNESHICLLVIFQPPHADLELPSSINVTITLFQ